MNIYIASSWKNQHAVEMLTAILRQSGHKVGSFIEDDNFDLTQHTSSVKWSRPDQGQKTFDYDMDAAMNSDLVIYVGPSECDAWAQVGAAWAAGTTIFGLISNGEQIGFMRRMVTWFDNVGKMLDAIESKG